MAAKPCHIKFCRKASEFSDLFHVKVEVRTRSLAEVINNNKLLQQVIHNQSFLRSSSFLFIHKTHKLIH